jgi:adenylate cyclase
VRSRTALRLRIIAGVTLASAAAGAVYGAGFAPAGSDIAIGALVGAMNGLAITALEIVLRGPGAAALRRLPLVPVLALRTLVYAAVFHVTGMAANSLAAIVAPGSLDSGMVMRPSLPFSLAVALGFNIYFVLSGLLGSRVLVALAIGRYRRPRSEQRAVLFLGLHDSTHHAERLGDKDFHRFLNQVFFDISDPVLDAGGEIYRYVGDEIIVTWPLARAVQNAACVACFFAVEEALIRRSGEYRRAFDAEPRLRGALHCGALVVGEMGDLKREIVMLGDTMNTAARIEEMCRVTGHDFLASAAVLKAVACLPPGVNAEALGEVALRGREADVPLVALSRRRRCDGMPNRLQR